MHEVLVNRLGGLSLPRKSVARLTDRPDMTLDVYHGRKTTIQQSFKSQLTLNREAEVSLRVAFPESISVDLISHLPFILLFSFKRK